MSKKIAFITGANRGLGRETARELAERGLRVVMGSRDLAKGEAAAKELRDKGFDATALEFDVNDPADHRRAFDYFSMNFGRLDILVNNAGVALGALGSPESRAAVTPQAILRDTFESNFFSQVALTQTLLPLIRKSPAGRIVNLASILGSLTLHADPQSPIADFKSFAYNASKTALNAFTVHLAADLRDTNIKVNSAHPGWVKTDMGGESAPMDVRDGGKTSAQLALLGDDGPTGGFFHVGERLPW